MSCRYQPIKRSYRIRPLLHSQSSRKQRYKKAGNTLSGSHKNVFRPHVLKGGAKSICLSSGSKCLCGTDQKRYQPIKRSYRIRPLLYSQSSRNQRYKKAGNTLSGSHKNVFRPMFLKEGQNRYAFPLAASVYVEQTRKGETNQAE
ncbi:hypothetical protein CDAR_396511 [Caerostris darwini]|uniref:Ribosomal protein L34 n=1 Tax=Caerostris darwini TaxID=1538125 RepID=A0AAV4PQP2_9ARAC|nr:hypothetical protein CDAR_396511 [Caerostris darwini]